MSIEPEEKSPPGDDDMLVPRALLALRRPYAAPRTRTEKTVAEIWRDALAMDRVGVDDDYRELGGDSLLAALIFAAIERRFGVSLPTSALLKAWTVAALSRKIDAARAKDKS